MTLGNSSSGNFAAALALYLVPVYQVGREALQDKARANDTSCGHI